MMSYDVWFEIDVGGEDPVEIGGDYLNYTYNCSPMFRAALGGNGINDLDGMLAGDAIERLEQAVNDIRNPENLQKYTAMNPPNKWGDHEGAAHFLECILRGARLYPKTTIRVG